MRIKKMNEGAQMPKRATEGSAGYDLYLPDDVYIMPGRQVVPLGIKIALPKGTYGYITSRSGFAAQGMLDIDDARKDADVISGKVDEDYTGEVGVIIHSHESYPFKLTKGTRIAQLIIVPYITPDMEWVEDLDETDRGAGGFGHSGK